MTVNALIHKVEVVDRLTVEAVKELRDALAYFGSDDELDDTYAVELLSETLSDGSTVYSVRVRPVNA